MKKLFIGKSRYKVVEFSIDQVINVFPNSPLIDDMNGKSIPLQSETAFFIPVLNHLVSRQSFLEWDSQATYHRSDEVYQDRNIERYIGPIELTENYYPDAII